MMSQATLLLPEFHPCLLCEAVAPPRRQPNSSARAIELSLLGHLALLCGCKLGVSKNCVHAPNLIQIQEIKSDKIGLLPSHCRVCPIEIASSECPPSCSGPHRIWLEIVHGRTPTSCADHPNHHPTERSPADIGL